MGISKEWCDIIVRKSTVHTLWSCYTIEQLKQMFYVLCGRESRCTNPKKLARLVKDVYVRKYSDSKLSVLLGNIECYDKIHLVTFQRREIYDDVIKYGSYKPNPRFGTEPETEILTADRLGYYPVWFVNPLLLGQSLVDVDSFCLRSFMGYYETAFPMRRYDISNDYYLFEIIVDRQEVTDYNSSYLCTCLPSIEKDKLLGVYSFYRNDPDCGFPNTSNEPYIKVVDCLSDRAMCSSDYAAAIEYDTYTGTEDDFNL